MINQDLLEILVCPECRKQVQLNEQQDGLICGSCKVIYEIKDNIPIMLIDEARCFGDENGDN